MTLNCLIPSTIINWQEQKIVQFKYLRFLEKLKGEMGYKMAS